jgi:hypothetical protein
MSETARDFQVDRHDLGRYRWAQPAPAPETPAEGLALLCVRRFAFTANNITYARHGTALRFWDFFPAEAGWGHIPVWGFAEVGQSRAPGLGAGERVLHAWRFGSS